MDNLYLIICENQKEANYIFKQTIRVLSDLVNRVAFVEKKVYISAYTFRFVSFDEYESRRLSTLRAKEIYGRAFEKELDEYEKKITEGGGE